MLTWQQSEFLLKGVYLGLLVTIAWLMRSWVDVALVAGVTLMVFLGMLAWAAVRKIRQGYHVKGRWLGFIFLLLIENTVAVYSGLLAGLSFGAWLTFAWFDPPPTEIPIQAIAPVLGGAILGGIFYGLHHVQQPMHRFWIGLAMVAILVLGAAATYYFQPDILAPATLRNVGLLLLLGIPGFYLLTFSGLVEESEIEIAAMCAALGLGLWTFLASSYGPAVSGSVVLLPLALFFVYTTRALPYLRVLKHTLRGMSYRQMGQTQLALVSLGRALQYEPRDTLARQQMWVIHRDLDFAELRNQPEVVPYLNFNFCLERVSQILATKPSAEDLRETRKMLDLIAREEPARQPVCTYWQAVAHLHEHNYEQAAHQLTSILQLPQTPTPQRQAIHFAAWSLAMFGHPEMGRRVGNVLLPLPGERMDAIAAVETQLAATPEDPVAWDMKRQLYSDLTESEYSSAPPADAAPTRFNHEYVQQLGLALLENRQEWQRGCEYLRIAARGLPLQAATIFIQIAQSHEKHGDADGMWANYQQAMQIGRRVGVQNLAAADKEALFATVKKIGDEALAQKQLDAALEAYKFYSQNDNAGIETWRMLAELFERKAASDPRDYLQYIWHALHCTEHALTYNAEDKDLLARKDRYYYSIPPDDLQARLETVRLWFDPQYCRDKARWVLEHFNGDFELLDWGSHLVELALVAQPGSHAARLLKARVRRLRGEIPETIAILEEVRQHRPEKFANEDEAKAWFFAHRMLGDLYLDDKPAEAIACYVEFRKSDEAGADTAFKLGKAFEALGDFGRAAKCYEEVTVFERHPLFYEARDALDRVKRGVVS